MARPSDDVTLVDALVQLSFRVQGVLASAAAPDELSITQVRLLGILRDRTPGVLELAAALGLEKSSVTGLLDRAERRGLVRRTAAAHDGRAVDVRLTPAGHEVAERVQHRVAAQLEILVADLPERTRNELRRTATRILRAGD